MKAAFWTAAAALMGSAMAADHRHHHEHAALHRRAAADVADSEATCGCYTSVVTYWGAPTLVSVSATPSPTSTSTSTSTPTPTPTTTLTSTTTIQSTSYSTVVVKASSSSSALPSPSPSTSSSSSATPLPVDTVTVFPSPGTYTIPATTLTVSSSTVVPQPTTTSLTSGTHTIGGVTTVVETSTTIVCPFATVSPSGSTVTDVIMTTTYICPTPGTYTIAPITTTVPESTVVVYPVPATVTPGTYTKSEQTVTVAVTSYTYFCPFADSSTSSIVAAAAPTTTASPAPVSTTSAVVSSSASSTSSFSSSSSSSSSAPAASSSSAGTGSSLGKVSPYAVTYTGYNHESGSCMTVDEVKTELENIQVNEYYALRMYSTDCNQMETVASQAISMGLRLILGVYIGSGGVSSGSSQVSEIVNWGKANNWEGIEFILLDNEAVSDGYCTASELASFVTSAKETISAAGYTGEFSIAEPLDIWQSDASTLCSVVDFPSANLQAFFNSDVEASEAGSFVASEVEILKTLCPQTETVFVSESGWPTQGETNGKAVPGVSEQKAAIDSIRSALGNMTAQFSYKNDAWKSPGDFGVEQYWGIYDMLNESD